MGGGGELKPIPAWAHGNVFWQLISGQKTDSSAHLDKRSKQNHVSSNSRFDPHSRFAVLFENNVTTCFVDTTVELEQPAVLSNEACCLYAGVDWLSSSVRQRVARDQYPFNCKRQGDRVAKTIRSEPRGWGLEQKFGQQHPPPFFFLSPSWQCKGGGMRICSFGQDKASSFRVPIYATAR